MKVWLDDVRPAPAGWTLATSAEAAIALLKTGAVEDISLDHDLGLGEAAQTASGLWVAGSEKPIGTGYDVACWIEEQARLGVKPPRWRVHSSNPAGAARIRAAMESACRNYTNQRRNYIDGTLETFSVWKCDPTGRRG